MNKNFFIIFALLGIAFLAITIMKYYPLNSNVQSAEIKSQKETRSSNSKVIDFWNFYDKATDLRTQAEYKKAITYYKKALEIDSTHKNSLYYLGNMYLAEQNFEEAETSWKKLSNSHSQSARGHLQLGNLYSCKISGNSLYNLESAKDQFQAAVRINAEETGPLLQLAKIRMVDGKYDEAEKMLNNVTSSNFRSIEAYFLAGYLYWKKGDIDGARHQLEQAASIFSESGEKTSNVGEGETKEGNSPMLAASFRCSLFSEFIVEQIDKNVLNNSSSISVYRRLEKELSNY